MNKKPLGGVDKETFVHSADNPVVNAELTYNLLIGLKYDVCRELKVITEQLDRMHKTCGHRMEMCENVFDSRYVRRWSEKMPLSVMEVILAFISLGFAIGFGVLTWKDIIRIALPK
jgi:hypothetical protein